MEGKKRELIHSLFVKVTKVRLSVKRYFIQIKINYSLNWAAISLPFCDFRDCHDSSYHPSYAFLLVAFYTLTEPPGTLE